MGISDYFSTDYRAARTRFRDAAGAAGARLAAVTHPHAKGPDGAALAADIAWLGPTDAEAVLLTVSATHGAEGFCGSGVQTGSFASGVAGELPPGTALMALHAVNPYGFAWLRRVNEDNVDLNRNFVDHRRPLPPNPGYDALADAICPAEWSAPARAAAQARLDAYALRHGSAALQRAVSGGQYAHPEGVFYGGTAPSWSRELLIRIIAERCARVQRLALIDYHTGLGPYGHGELIVSHGPASPALARARRWYGDRVTVPALGSSASAELHGDNIAGLETMLPALLPRLAFTGMALEYGVVALRDTLDAVRADNWLHVHGQLDSPQGRAIKRLMREAFYGDRDDWKAMIFEQAVTAQRQALAGLAADRDIGHRDIGKGGGGGVR